MGGIGTNCTRRRGAVIATVNRENGPKMKMAQEVLRHCQGEESPAKAGDYQG